MRTIRRPLWTVCGPELTPGFLKPDVTANDTGEWDRLDVLTETSHGTLTRTDEAEFAYEPDAGFTGIDTFVYQLVSTRSVNLANPAAAAVAGSPQACDTATVTISVQDGRPTTFPEPPTSSTDCTNGRGDPEPRSAPAGRLGCACFRAAQTPGQRAKGHLVPGSTQQRNGH